MRIWVRVLTAIAGLIVVFVAGLFLWLYLAPSELLRVGAGYSSKIVCSNVFLAKRDPGRVFAVDVQAPGNPILGDFALTTDRTTQKVTSKFLNFIAPMASVYRPGLGCAAVPDGNLAGARAQTAPLPPGPAASTAPWPEGTGVADPPSSGLKTILADDRLAGPGMRAIVVVKDGRIVGERYAPGFDAKTPLIGWSMTKTVTAALVGTVIKAGKLQLDQDHLLTRWDGDGRSKITVAELLSMSSGLKFNEDYGDVSDVTRMLYLEPDMAKFAASKPLAAVPGTRFNYSTGTPVILSRIWQNALADEQTALAWPRKALFGPLGMGSAVLETDEAGTFVGGAYLYATARDWARFGQFLLQDGVWEGKQILPRSYVEMMHQPAATNAAYGQGLLWMEGPGDDHEAGSDADYGVPADAYWLEGHDGQTVTVIPSANMVVVRMGLTPAWDDYKPQKLVAALLAALG